MHCNSKPHPPLNPNLVRAFPCAHGEKDTGPLLLCPAGV